MSQKTKQISCNFASCVFVTGSVNRMRKHIVFHETDTIYDYAFEHGLLPGPVHDSQGNVGDKFHYVVSQILKVFQK